MPHPTTRQQLFAFAPLLLALLIINPVQAKEISAQDLSAWAGSYPSDRPAQTGQTPWPHATDKSMPAFFDIPLVKQQMQRLLPPARIREVKRQLTVSPPVEQKGGYVLIAGCEPHNCPGRFYSGAFNLQTGDAVFMFRHRTDKQEQFTCYADAANLMAFPPAVAQSILLDAGEKAPWLLSTACQQPKTKKPR